MLQLPLRSTVAANLLMQIVLRQLGGKGSGNFGHAGRPGKRGGSSDEEEGLPANVAVKQGRPGSYDVLHQGERVGSVYSFKYAGTKMWKFSGSTQMSSSREEAVKRLLRDKGIKALGGQGSGNFGHEGRPGEVGGSSDSDWFNVKKPSYPAGPKNEKGYSATFIGFMEALPGEEPIALFNVSGGPLSGSSVMQETLEREGIPLPPYPKLKSLGGKGSGNYGHSGRPGEKGGSSEGSGPTEKVRNARSLRALKAFIPIHAESQRYAEANELSVRRMVGGTRTEGNAPVDVEVVIDGRKKGIEVKTMVNNTNDKITMRKAAVEKKDLWGRRNHASVHTVVLDDRGKLGHKEYSGHRLYYRKGSGSFRLAGMIKVTSPQHLKELLSK